MILLSRRRFLELGAAATASSALAGCGGSDTAQPEPLVVALFSPNRVIAAGLPQRLPFGVIANGAPLTDSAVLPVRVLVDGKVIDELDVPGRLVKHDHSRGFDSTQHEHADLQRYYAVRTLLPEPGIYDLEITIGERRMTLPVQAFDRAQVSVALPGDSFPRLDTPTLDDVRGVDPLCSLIDGPCAFHQQTAASILDERRPLALLVATPAFCSTAYCGPSLETLIEAARGPLFSSSDIGFVHVEPWANPREGQGLSDPGLRLAPTPGQLGLEFEPALFLVDRSGILVERIDNVFDSTELDEALALIS